MGWPGRKSLTLKRKFDTKVISTKLLIRFRRGQHDHLDRRRGQRPRGGRPRPDVRRLQLWPGVEPRRAQPLVLRLWRGAAQDHGVQVGPRAGHLRYFWIFSIVINYFFCIFYQVNNLSFISAPVLFKKLTPSQVNLIKMQKMQSFFIIEKIQKHLKCPALPEVAF